MSIVHIINIKMIPEEKDRKWNPAYFKGLSSTEKKKRKKEIDKREDEPSKNPSSYRPFSTDKNPKTGEPKKTKPSVWNKKFKEKFGESTMINEYISLLIADILDEVLHEKLEDEYILAELDILEEKKKGGGLNTILKNKAKKANAPLGALKTIARKGLSAWRTGHRPGASPQAWAVARVNSVLAGGPARKVDAAQWKQIQKFRSKKRKSK